jgi:hypothetical protein
MSTEDNKALVRRFIAEVINCGNWAVADALRGDPDGGVGGRRIFPLRPVHR